MTLRAALILVLSLCPATAEEFPLQFDRLTGFFTKLTVPDRQLVDESIALIKKGNHNLALIQLQKLVGSNSNNAGVRVLLAYSFLNVGNTLGAFDEAKTAERTGHDSYVCLFLAKVAYAVGEPSACKREIKHVKSVGTPEDIVEAKELEKRVDKMARKR